MIAKGENKMETKEKTRDEIISDIEGVIQSFKKDKEDDFFLMIVSKKLALVTGDCTIAELVTAKYEVDEAFEDMLNEVDEMERKVALETLEELKKEDKGKRVAE